MEDNPSDADDSEATADTDQNRSVWEPSERPSVAVVEAIAASTNRDPTDIPPLYKNVDPDALDAIATSGTSESENSIRISFVHDGVKVTVDNRKGIELRPITEDNH